MKKAPYKLILTFMAIIYGSLASADGFYGYEEHHRHHHDGYGYYGPQHFRERQMYYPAPPAGYYAQPPVNYYPQPPVNYYPPQPQRQYQPAPPQYYNQNRNNSGMVGGIVGSAIGYQVGRGDPLVTGLGAAAGAFVGNGR